MKSLVLFIIRFYKKYLTGYLEMYFGGGCRFTPTCSEYAYGAIEKYGIMKGFYLSGKRIIKCNPGSVAGFDPVK